jgi:hypothetical protein
LKLPVVTKIFQNMPKIKFALTVINQLLFCQKQKQPITFTPRLIINGLKI